MTQETARAEAVAALAEAIHGSEHWRHITNRELAGRLLTYLDANPAAKAALARYIEDGMTIIATDQVEAFCRSVLATPTSEATRGEGLTEAVVEFFDAERAYWEHVRTKEPVPYPAPPDTPPPDFGPWDRMRNAKVALATLVGYAAQPGEPPEEERAMSDDTKWCGHPWHGLSRAECDRRQGRSR